MKLPFTIGVFCAPLAGGLLLFSACTSTPPKNESPAVRIRWAQDPESLDPLRLVGPQAIEGINLLHAGLLQLNYDSRQFEPALAESQPQINLIGDSLTQLTYRLRPGATWDDGKPVLARDVAFTVKLMFCPGMPNEAAQARYGFIKDVQLDASDERRLTFVCRGQAPDFAQATGVFAVLSEASLDAAGQLNKLSILDLRRAATQTPADTSFAGIARRYQAFDYQLPGCGAYTLRSWVKDRALTFERKTAYWADKLPAPVPAVLQARPAALRYEIVPSEATATLALQRGELDVYPQMTARDFDRLQQSATAQKSLAFYTASSYDVVTAGFNTRRPVLADALTRQALSRLFDADGLLKATQRGSGVRSVGLISPYDKAHYNDSLTLIPYDVAGAEALLKRAGWQRDAQGWSRPGRAGQSRQALRLALRYRPDESVFETIALQFREAAGRLNIPVELRPTESAALKGILKKGDFDMYLRTLKGNPFVFNFAPILHSKAIGDGNATGFGTPASDQLIEAVAAAESPAEQRRLLRRFQAVLHEQVPFVPLFFLSTRVVASRRLASVRAYDFKPGYVSTALDWADKPATVATR